MRNIMVVFGTRPEAIKMCPLIQELKRDKEMRTTVCVTGQHKQMLTQVLNAFEVIPDYDLCVMRENQTLFDITCSVMASIKNALEEVKPDVVLVHGDTTTTFAAALSSFYEQIPVGHVEAGLRTHDIYAPFPEEFNRQATGVIAQLHFAPTESAKANLVKEGKDSSSIFVTGNTAIDALRTTVREDYSHELLKWAEGSRLIMMTAHRRENLGENLYDMFRAINRIVEEFEDVKVIFPVHLNPIVQNTAKEVFSESARIKLVAPMDVVDFHNFLARCYLILTDSGGIQEEAPSLGKPVLVMRDSTERPEGIEAGTLKLVGTQEKTIYKAFRELLEDEKTYQSMSAARNPYGDGYACRRIVEILKNTK